MIEDRRRISHRLHSRIPDRVESNTSSSSSCAVAEDLAFQLYLAIDGVL